MTNIFTCPNAHSWQILWNDSTTPCPSVTRCPICGFTTQQHGKSSSLHSSDATVEQLEKSFQYPSNREPRSNAPRIPGYEIFHELGNGGMGVVYLANQLDHNRKVAIKVIRQDRLSHPDTILRFRREAQAAFRLAHPNVVLFFDSDHEGDCHYLVMEYVQGITLQELVEQKGPLDIPVACEYIRQASLGLAHAHAQGLVHRDIKPANLMLTGHSYGSLLSNPGLVKILDMGIARILQHQESPESITTLTQPGVVIGTADFIAPEQLESPHTADHRADIYSLGCTFYFLITGQVPFPVTSVLMKLDGHRWKHPVPVEYLRPETPPPVRAMISFMMEKKPEERAGSAEETARRLRDMAKGNIVHLPTRRAKIAMDTIEAHNGGVVCMTSNWATQTLISAGKDHHVKVWNLTDRKLMYSCNVGPIDVRSVCIHPKSGNLVVGAGLSVRIIELQTGREIHRYLGHSGQVKSVAVSPDGRRIISCGDDRTVRVWDNRTLRELLRFVRHRGPVNTVAVSDDNDRVVSAGKEPRIRVWHIGNGQEICHLQSTCGQVMDCAISQSGHYAVTGHFDTTVRIWDLTARRELRRMRGHKKMITAVDFTPDSLSMVSASQDETLRLWDVESGAELESFAGHAAGILGVEVVPSGKEVISGSLDGTIKFWDIAEIR